MRRAIFPLWRLLLVVLALAGRPARAQSPTALHEAVADARVAVTAVASAEFGQLSLTLRPLGDAVMVTVWPGTRFVPDDPALSPLINTERVELLVQDEVTIDPLRVMSLTPDKGLPLPTHTTTYHVDGLAGGPLSELLERAAAGDLVAAPALQLAVWAAAGGQAPADINAGLNAPYATADVTTAQALLAGLNLPQATPSEPGAMTVVAPTDIPDEGGNNTTGGGLTRLLVWGGLGILLVAAIITAVVAASQRPKRAAVEPALRPDGRAPRIVTNGNRLEYPPVARPPTETLGQVGLTLVGDDGPHTGHTFTVTEDTVIARSPIAVLELPLTGLYSPHVCLYWSATGIEVKDLNSAGGAELDGRPLGREFTVAGVGSRLRLAGTIMAELRADAIVVNGARYSAPPGNVILSRKPLSVYVLGEADKGVSDPHCIILREGGQFVIRDLNSRNGVHLNDMPIGRANEVIPDGALLRLGKTTLFRCSLGQDM